MATARLYGNRRGRRLHGSRTHGARTGRAARALERHVARRDVPGLVALVVCGDNVHVEAIGNKDFDDGSPSSATPSSASCPSRSRWRASRDAAHRGRRDGARRPGRTSSPSSQRRGCCARSNRSSTTPCLQSGRSPWRTCCPSTSVTARSWRCPTPTPIQRAERALDLKTYSEPWPPTDLTPDEWIAALGRLPLLHQPGAGWRYNTGAHVAGVLIGSGGGAPLADVLHDRIFEPLGMADTGFFVPSEKLHRFTTQYTPDAETGELRLLDRPDGWWSVPPRLPSAAGGLVSTVDDVWAFASMLASDGGELPCPHSPSG